MGTERNLLEGVDWRINTGKVFFPVRNPDRIVRQAVETQKVTDKLVEILKNVQSDGG